MDKNLVYYRFFREGLAFVKALVFRALHCNMHIGIDFRIYGTLKLRYKPKSFVVGNKVRILGDVIIDCYRNGELSIGDDVVLDSCIISPRNGKIYIGKNSFVGPFSIIQAFDTGPVYIGSNVMIAKGAAVFASNHGTDLSGIPMKLQPENGIGIYIDDDVWIGANCAVVDGVKISHGTVVGAGSVVTRNTTADTLYCGVPARILRGRS